MRTLRHLARDAAEQLRDLRIRLSWKVASVVRRRDEPDGDAFGRFLKQAGDITDPERDEHLMAFWLVTRRMPGPPMPEALESAYFRFRGRRRRDPERARAWRGYILRWAEIREEENPLTPGERGGEPPDASADSVRGRLHRSGSRPAEPRHLFLRRTIATAAVVVAAGLATWVIPSGRHTAERDLPPASALGIEQLERGSKSLVEQALRARYIETLHQVQRVRITAMGEGMDFERILLEGARLDVERAIDRHLRADGRVPPRLYLLLGKLSLLTEFETEGRRALARASIHGGAVGTEAQELLALLPE